MWPDESRDERLCCVPEVEPKNTVQDGWTLYAWDGRRMCWMTQVEYTNVSLEVALTAMLRWKSQGQIVRMDSVPNFL